MNKITLIAKREYLTRIKKKSFIIMTILGPLLMAAIFIIPIWLSSRTGNDNKHIAVIDKSETFQDAIPETENIKIDFITNKSIEDLQAESKEGFYYAVLIIPENAEKEDIILYSYKQPSIEVTQYIKQNIETKLKIQKLQDLEIDLQKLEKANISINIDTYKWTKTGDSEKSFTEINMIIGFIAALIIYMFIFMYGIQVMKGVMEEKTSRIVEIIVSSVKPFQLMLGKIIGVALVAFTQFSIWLILSACIFLGVKSFIPKTTLPAQNQQITEGFSNNEQMEKLTSNGEIAEIFSAIMNVDYLLLIFSFLFFFVAGYLLYASLFAAVGAAVDNETDTQQFMLPITIPLILAFVMAQTIITDPSGSIAFWFSIIPFTSPVIMMVRIAFGVPEVVPYWQLFLSMFLLILTFIGSTWVAGKIYRTGILLYGKKITYKELWKWLMYKNT